MDNIFFTLLAFIFTIALLVAIHEFGHFWVARKLDVKVLRFSIGFGKPLLRFNGKKDNTEFVIASIPLGGYVKMLDEREGEVAKEEYHREFNQKSVYSRFAIVFAGPFVNFLFAVFAFWLMFIIGIQGVIPIMGQLDHQSLAWESGLRNGDQIISVNGKETPTFTSVYEELLGGFIARKSVDLQLSDQRRLVLHLEKIEKDVEPSQLKEVIGLSVKFPLEKVIIGEVNADSPAFSAGIQAGDQVLAIDEQQIDHWRDLVRSIINKPDKKINIKVLRNEKVIIFSVIIGHFKQGSKTIGRIGVRPKSVTPLPESMFTQHQYGIFSAIPKSIEKTWDLSILTITMLGKIIIGEASIKNISGPITIAEVAGQSAQMGWESFLRFLAIVSLSLGVINLLPIPMLDGGHLLFYLIEMIKGSPVSEMMQEFGVKIGVMLLAMLMSVALYNDFMRLLG
ncbi:MAG: RIP metalloprotease RseP [gamma proteobacterium symbiont of Taylorina sp.]|nr:RIP metalloprotease RseP [gamma proteobacterium symbiont of Taylorina sp.]